MFFSFIYLFIYFACLFVCLVGVCMSNSLIGPNFPGFSLVSKFWGDEK